MFSFSEIFNLKAWGVTAIFMFPFVLSGLLNSKSKLDLIKWVIASVFWFLSWVWLWGIGFIFASIFVSDYANIERGSSEDLITWLFVAGGSFLFASIGIFLNPSKSRS